jgi:hypothetical protein
VLGTLFALVALVAVAFALGGQHSSSSPLDLQRALVKGQAGTSAADNAPVHGLAPVVENGSGSGGTTYGASGGSGAASARAPIAAAVPAPAAAHSAASGAAVDVAAVSSGVTATRVVKTGSLDLQVRRGQVQPTIAKIVSLVNQMNGYVSQSRTDNVVGSPDGEVTLRMPVANFDETVADAARLGHETSLTTNAHDVTGRFVDLGARLSALKRTRSTYLTILGRATTIGSTLAVQQRVDDVQQQIEELQGQLKVLRNQSADGTLTVDVSQTGSTTTPAHHRRHGISKAWHTSISRFNRGIDAIVSGLGPLLLALLILALIAGIARLSLRGVRRATS